MAALGDDDESLSELHRDHARVLWAFVMKLTGDGAHAEDVVQETMIRAWRNNIMDDEAGSVRAWLFTVARNLVVDEVRSARMRHESAWAVPPERELADSVDSLFETMLVTDALRALSPDHRVVVVRAYFGHQSVDEIASALGIPAGTVKSRLHYGLRALRTALKARGVTQ